VNKTKGSSSGVARAELRLGDVEFELRGDTGERIWNRDAGLWAVGEDDPADRLGWLDLASTMEDRVPEFQEAAEKVRGDAVSEIALLGMGGSSLAPEMFAHTLGRAPGYPSLRVIDTTHPGEIEATTRALNLDRTLFVVSSKSGGTLETMSLYRYFRDLVPEGDRFVAITDEGTSLDHLARDEDFRAIFHSPSDVGGRYSALSPFGLVPAALTGVDIESLLSRAKSMSARCGPRAAAADNPGLVLGQALGALALRERHALTFLTSDPIASLAVWIEQLLAESTGKGGRGIVPIVGEPEVDPGHYGNDRSFVHLRLDGDDSRDGLVAELVARGHPVITLPLANENELGAEIFRWEFATAVAGAVLGVNPFDQPDVEAAKRAGREALGSNDLGAWPDEDPAELFEASRPGELAALLVFAARSPRAEETLTAGRRRVLLEHGLATTAGFGPRYLHSTGQLHKGGPPSLRALVVLETDVQPLGVPGAEYDFADLVGAQASGDAAALEEAGRKVSRTGWKRFEGWARGNSWSRERRA
jgi:transaldolase/glucose-6-phosphate isomerase